MYRAYYAPLPDADAYLERIGLTGKGEPTLENLQRLIKAHVTHVPFENLTAYWEHKVPDLTVAGVFEKIVKDRRGGWCHELNNLFYTLLQDIGYEAYPVACRVVAKIPDPGPIGHRATVCTIEGKQYYCDVGYGGAMSFYAVPMDGAPNPEGLFISYDGPWCCVNKTFPDGSTLRMIQFYNEPALPVDFLTANYYQATGPDSHFRNNLVVTMRTGTGKRSLTGLSYHESGLPDRELQEQELLPVLKEKFGLVLK